MERRNYPTTTHDDARRRILDGEEAQLTIRYRDWIADLQVTEKVVGELRLRTNGGRWQKNPCFVLYPNPDNGPEDAASILGSYTHWLEAGRANEVPSRPTTDAEIDALPVLNMNEAPR
jgi:hypothetical protein